MNLKRTIAGPILSLVFLLFFVYMIAGIQLFFSDFLQKYSVEDFSASLSDSINLPVVAQKTVKMENTIGLDIYAQSAISVLTSGTDKDEVLYYQNGQRKLSIASISKLMTALVVMENVDLSKEITISSIAANQSSDPEELKVGETFLARDLLYAMLIGSDNTASAALSEVIGTEQFIILMNNRAKELGLSDTSFMNPTGLGLANFSTAQDLVTLAKYLLENYRSILGISSMQKFDLYTVNGKILHEIVNTDKLLNNKSELAGRIIGSKTGETRTAGECLLLVLKAPNNRGYLINVILNSDDRFGETEKIINWVDTNYQW